jgi:hypothetical protein
MSGFGFNYRSQQQKNIKIIATGVSTYDVPVFNPWGQTSISVYISGTASVTLRTNPHTKADYDLNADGEQNEFIDWPEGAVSTSGKYILQQPHNYLQIDVVITSGYVRVVIEG